LSTVTTADGNNSITVFLNTASQHVVFAFKGSDNFSDFRSGIANSGGAEWESIKPLANQAFASLKAAARDQLDRNAALSLELRTDGKTQAMPLLRQRRSKATVVTQ
jgi:hypothetical protein